MAGYSKTDVKQCIKGEKLESFQAFKSFAKSNVCVNYFAERNMRLIKDFVKASCSEDMKQNIMLVANNNRKILPRDLKKKDFKKI